MSGQDNHLIECQDSLDISMVTDFSVELSKALEIGQPVTIQAAKVERADTAALQLLCAFFLDARAAGITVEWQGPSDALKTAALQLGLAEHIGLDEASLH